MGVHLDVVKAEDGQTGPAIPEYSHVTLSLMRGEAFFEMSELFPSAGGYFLRLVASDPNGIAVSQVVPVFIEDAGATSSVPDASTTSTLTASQAYELAQTRIAEAEATNATTLDLSGLRLETIPPEIGNLSKLQVLYLYDNHLTELPPEIGNLSNLEVILAHNNRLTALPSEIGNLSNLQNLHLGGNQIGELPPEIGQLVNLQRLSLNFNQLSDLPSEIVELTQLCELTISSNQFGQYPDILDQLPLLHDEGCRLSIFGNPYNMRESADSAQEIPSDSGVEVSSPAIVHFTISYPDGNQYDKTIVVQWDTLAWGVHLETVQADDGQTGPAIPDYSHVTLPLMEGEAIFEMSQLFPSDGGYFLRLVASDPNGIAVSQVVPVFIEPTETIRPSFDTSPTDTPPVSADTAPFTSEFGSQFIDGNNLDDVITLTWSVRGDGAYLQVVDAADGSGGSPIAGYERLALPLPSGQIQLPVHQLVPSSGEYVLRLVGIFQNEITETLSNQIEVAEGSGSAPAPAVGSRNINQFEVSFPNDNRFDQTIAIHWDTRAENVHLEVTYQNPDDITPRRLPMRGYEFFPLPSMTGEATLNINQLFPAAGTYYMYLIATQDDGTVEGRFALVEIQSSPNDTSNAIPEPIYINYFEPVEDVIRYDSYAQGPTVYIVARWDVYLAEVTYVFEQIMSDGEVVGLSTTPPADAPELASGELYLQVCVGAAGCEYDGGITLRLSVYDAEGVMVDSKTTTIGVEHVSISNPQ